MRRLILVALAAAALGLPAQQATDPAEKNAQQARQVLDQMVQALGGEAWMHQQSMQREGHVAAFFHGQPEPGTTQFWEFHAWPDHDRFEYTKHRDVVQMYVGRQGWEVTYKGKKPLPAEQVDDFLRRRDHSIETAVKIWLKDARTILVYEGQHLAARRLADQVTLISPENEAVTILTDTQTHLPLKRVFQWRDPVYKDKNTDSEEYDDYHTFDGFPTPFTITRYKNDEIIQQRYMDHVHFNQPLADDLWNVDHLAQRIKK